MKILVTGATGFIGSAFVRRALEEGHSIGALIRGERSPHEIPNSASSLRWLRGTLTDAPWKEIADFGPELCVHAAWTTAPKVAYDSPAHFDCLAESQSFLRRIIDIGIQGILGIGTCIEYRISHERLSEERTPIAPIGPYAESKNAMRVWLEDQAQRQGFRATWARIFYVYGVGENPTRLCSSLIQKLKRNESVVLKTPQSTKDYIYIDDVADALLMLADKSVAGPINIGTGTGVTIYDLAQTLARLLGKADLVHSAVAESPDPLDYVVADSSRLRDLGWQPRYDLERGLRELIVDS